MMKLVYERKVNLVEDLSNLTYSYMLLLEDKTISKTEHTFY